MVGGEKLERIRSGSVERTARKVPSAPELSFPGGWLAAQRERTKALTAGRAEIAGVSGDDPGFHEDFVNSNRRFFDAHCVAYLCMLRALSSWSIFDLGMMAQSIMLAAQEHGVDSAIAVNFVVYPDLIREEIDIPEDQMIVIGIALGFVDGSGAEDAFRSTRRELDDAVRFVL